MIPKYYASVKKIVQNWFPKEKESLDDWSYIDANPAKWAEDELFVE